MAILVADGFEITTNIPVDSRAVVADLAARDAMSLLVRYQGLACFVIAEQKEYTLKTGITNADWDESGGGGGSDPEAGYVYIKGDAVTDGSWRFIVPDTGPDAGKLQVENRKAGDWNIKGRWNP